MSNTATNADTNPLVLAGPILRRVTGDEVVLWLVTSQAVDASVELQPEDATPLRCNSNDTLKCKTFRYGEHMYIHLLRALPPTTLPQACWIGYDILLQPDGDPSHYGISHWGTALSYTERDTPGFVLQPKINRLLHGSCRKPHLIPAELREEDDSGDGLARADALLQETSGQLADWPALLLLTGDQVYVDDVAGPMLFAIHQLIRQLGLPTEPLSGTDLSDSKALVDTDPNYYQRDQILPSSELAGEMRDQFFGGKRKPVFTSANARNHLVSLSEMLAMYLLVWSPQCWDQIKLDCPDCIKDEKRRERYAEELTAIEEFRQGLTSTRRLLANVPVAMIFDDHDVTDDWNLSAGWEISAYDHPLSRRVIGNALIAYLLCQGWGNAPEHFPQELLGEIDSTLQAPGSKEHDECIDHLLGFNYWHFSWTTTPVLIVLDTRTHRWRSERGINRPSGLMDWEAITDLQHQLLDHQAVIMVSPAPVFGVKLIEGIQGVFTYFGKPLLVDAENWMAHRGAAYALLNLFRHKRTPRNFVILSGDVHYSFVYDIELRSQHLSPNIWQITSSGIRNEFPPRLLDVLDRLNRWLYAPWSPLNWFTKRRGMRVTPRKPVGASRGERLLNAAGIGLVELDDEGAPVRVAQLCAACEDVEFEKQENESRWE